MRALIVGQLDTMSIKHPEIALDKHMLELATPHYFHWSLLKPSFLNNRIVISRAPSCRATENTLK